MTKTYRICTKCEIHHFENCERCFGFGVYSLDIEGGIVRADEAHDKNFRGKVIKCPECGSDETGCAGAGVVVDAENSTSNYQKDLSQFATIIEGMAKSYKDMSDALQESAGHATDEVKGIYDSQS